MRAEPDGAGCHQKQPADWFRKTAIQHIRPVELDELTSKRYWEKWERVNETDLHTIAHQFFERIRAAASALYPERKKRKPDT